MMIKESLFFFILSSYLQLPFVIATPTATLPSPDIISTVNGGLGGNGGTAVPGATGGRGGLGAGPTVNFFSTQPTPQIGRLVGGKGGNGAVGNPPGSGGLGQDPRGALQYADVVVGGAPGSNGNQNNNFGRGGDGGVGGGPLIRLILTDEALQVLSNKTIPFHTGPFKSGNGGKGGNAGKSIGQWKGGKGGNGGDGGGAYIIWDPVTRSWLGVNGEDGKDGEDGEDAQIGRHGADGADGKHGSPGLIIEM